MDEPLTIGSPRHVFRTTPMSTSQLALLSVHNNTSQQAMSEDRDSGTSADWPLTSLFRPASTATRLSFNSHAAPSVRSLHESILPTYLLSIPSLFGRADAITPEPVQSGDEVFHEASSTYAVSSAGSVADRDDSPSEFTRELQLTDSGTDEISPISKPQTAIIPTIRAVRAESDSHDAEKLAELPAIRAKRRSIRAIAAAYRELEHTVKIDIGSLQTETPPEAQEISFQEKIDSNVISWECLTNGGSPVRWSKPRKVANALAIAFVTFCVSFASSCMSPAVDLAATELGVAPQVMGLTTTLFMTGLAVGPFIWGPVDETWGRKRSLFFGLAGFTVFQIPAGVAQNVQTVLVARFFQGVFGCSPFIAAITSLMDLWKPHDRGMAVSIFAAATIIGYCTGAAVGGPISASSVLGWRWCSWIVLIFCFPFALACWLVYRETSEVSRTRTVSFRQSINSQLFNIPLTKGAYIRRIVRKHLGRPWLMLASDGILLFMTVYMSYVYGIMYFILEAYPLSFMGARHWPLQFGGLPFLAVMVGVGIGCMIDVAFHKMRFREMIRKYGRLCPEERLLPMLLGSIALPIGLFTTAWASATEISAVPEIIAGAFLGIAFTLIFLQGNMYLLETYANYANSAMAINTCIRCLVAAAFTAFARAMYLGLQPQWAGTMLAILSLVCISIPITIFRKGVKFRATSKWTPKLPPGLSGGNSEGDAEKRQSRP